MTDKTLPPLWLDLLAETAASPDGILSLKENRRGEEALAAAERMTDLGLLRIVTARRYRLSEAGRAALGTRPKSKAPKPPPVHDEATPEQASPGFWSRLFGKG